MRAGLTLLYRVAEGLGAVCLVLIAILILANIAARNLGYVVRGLDEFAMYFMAASYFLMLAPALRRGSHIRVGIVIDRLRGTTRRAFEILCLVTGSALAVYFAWWWALMTWDSYDFGDVSQGVVPIPLWIPQGVMGLGLAALAVALLDDLAAVLRGRPASYENADMASEG